MDCDQCYIFIWETEKDNEGKIWAIKGIKNQGWRGCIRKREKWLAKACLETKDNKKVNHWWIREWKQS